MSQMNTNKEECMPTLPEWPLWEGGHIARRGRQHAVPPSYCFYSRPSALFVVKNSSLLFFVLFCVFCGHPLPVFAGDGFKKITLDTHYTSESVACADFNRDGHMDVVAGYTWYEGPSFEKRHDFDTPKTYSPHKYSDTTQPCFTWDFNNDTWPDIICVVRGGNWQTGMHWNVWLYENPRGKDQHWTRHLVLRDMQNESSLLADVNGDGRPEWLSSSIAPGFGIYDPERPTQPWRFYYIDTGKWKAPGVNRFGARHGMGIGDINGDGRPDILQGGGWHEQPENFTPEGGWHKHEYTFAAGSAQMLTYDVDGDGLNDVITVWHSHKYGLLWYRQLRDDTGGVAWEKNVILSPEPNIEADEFRISQLHALELADLNGDGLKDIVTGKRRWAHGPKGDEEPGQPPVVYWFELKRLNGRACSPSAPQRSRRDRPTQASHVEFIPHRIDDDSGVGAQIAVSDVTGDGKPDVLTSNKKGTYVFVNTIENSGVRSPNSE